MTATPRTVLVTGAAGFLGRHVARHFAAAGWTAVGVDALPPEPPRPAALQHHVLRLPSPEFRGLVRATRPAVLVHCAGRASVDLSMREPEADFAAHTVMTFEVLETLRREAPACRFVNLSSAAVYGNPRTLPVDESQPPAPISPYGFHKWQTDILCREYATCFGLSTASLRVFSAYGAGLRRQVMWDIGVKALAEGHVRLHGTGEESRDFVHVDDVARAVMTLATAEIAPGEAYNLGSGREVTIRELARTLLRLLGRDGAPEFGGEVGPGVPRNWCADVSRLRALGYASAVPLEQGLAGFATWCRAQMGRT